MEKKNLSRGRLTGKRGVDPDLLTYFDWEKNRERENLEELLFVCVEGFFFRSPRSSMSCAMTNSRVRQRPSPSLISRYIYVVFLELIFWKAICVCVCDVMRRAANLKSLPPPLHFSRPFQSAAIIFTLAYLVTVFFYFLPRK
jgi:hypothetical protein